ncbi:D-alanyl-D-alanine carboxypeptidase DacF [Thalassobacillus devorans]|uniref:serine-type D-Ala-D-Ala carboxypeptidase n=1 Tax=Thalassobacillus devorans TaxID=279813 RepID=A0ABQ1P4V7_9BACI|nr:D-alanyl-D-alanine carboxypeptidase family protein [Thalassobacillus devorans]NIK28377.1 D-alanyl-D-alanine carboxypeptidase (penicillin-binding protein 5/6) [Thalassobacillus devorans]GGC86824.1 D-alanyl-D-alanine carboxypeptidase DacF [Thalassobacillus devorans]
MKKIAIYFTVFLLVNTLIIPVTYGQESNQIELTEGTKSAVLMENSSGTILYDKNAHEKLPPASMTKIMTLLLIMEALEDKTIALEESVRISERAASMGGSQIFLEAGEEMTVADLLKGVAVASGNDASVALAERIAGSEEAFVQKMNDKAKELGLKNTKFQNTTGLPEENHYSTAYDMAVMAQNLLKYEDITNYTSIYEDYLRKGQENEFWLVNTNKLVKHYKGVDGLKTGYTNEAKYCLTATAEKNGMRMIAVVMGAKTPKERNANIARMLDYSYNQFETEQLYDKGYAMTTLHLDRADTPELDLVTKTPVTLLKRKGENLENVTTSLEYESEVKLPIEKGSQLATLKVMQGEKVLTEVPLVAETNIKQGNVWQLFKRTLGKMAHR